MKLAFRYAQAADLSRVTGLLAEVDGEPELAPEYAQRIFHEMARYPNYRCYLVFDGDEAIGTFSLLIFPTLVHDGRNDALVEGVVVAPAYRGRGVGRAMMQEAMRLAAKAGCYKLALSSNSKREDAHRFYRALGFIEHGVSFGIDL